MSTTEGTAPPLSVPGSAPPHIEARNRAAGVGALAFLLIVTAAWWALALWPLPNETPEWLTRTRSVCFNTGPSGLPDASGWLMLIGQPIGMVAVLMAVWGRAVRAGLRAMAGARGGRAVLAGSVALVLLGLSAAAVRVTGATGEAIPPLGADWVPPETYPRLDREAPELALVDQFGDRLDVADLRGRPALVTFAFIHCQTVCPLLVREALEAQKRVRERAATGEVEPSRVPRVVVVTLDPWRDTPSRLRYLADRWGFELDGFVLSGPVGAVNGVLDRWGVARERNPINGDVTHPPLVYVLAPSGRIAFAAGGGTAALLELLSRT